MSSSPPNSFSQVTTQQGEADDDSIGVFNQGIVPLGADSNVIDDSQRNGARARTASRYSGRGSFSSHGSGYAGLSARSIDRDCTGDEREKDEDGAEGEDGVETGGGRTQNSERLSLEYSADGDSFKYGTSGADLRNAFGNSRHSSRFLRVVASDDGNTDGEGAQGSALRSSSSTGSFTEGELEYGQRGHGGIHGMSRTPSSGASDDSMFKTISRHLSRKYSQHPGPLAIELSDDGETTVCCETLCSPCVWHANSLNSEVLDDLSSIQSTEMGVVGVGGDGPRSLMTIMRTSATRLREGLVRMWVWAIIESSWLCLLLLGVGSSVLAWSIDEAVSLLSAAKTELVGLAQSSIVSYVLWSLFTMGLAVGAVVATKRISPLAAGSGIPQIRSILAGFEIRGYLSLRTLVAKVVGLVLAQACGMVIGREGPFVHISCIMATQLLRLPLFSEIRDSPALKKQILAAACAVGVSSTFGAPIGGVLFSIEVTSSLYQTSQYWKSFFCVVCGAFAFREVSNFGQSEYNVVSLFTTNFEPLPYTFFELPVFVLLSVVCGYLAGLFVLCYQKMAEYRKVGPRYVTNSYSFALIVAFLTSAALFPLGDFMQYSIQNAIDDLLTNAEIANAAHSHLWDQPTRFINLLLFAWLKFGLAVLAINLPIPCGVFTPVFAVGAAIGRFIGEILQYMGAKDVTPGGYALVGAASFTAGATGTVSTAVIVFELTNQLSYMLPVLLSVLIGVACARNVGPNIYDALSIAKNLPHFPQFTRQSSYSMPIRKVMQEHTAIVPRLVTKQGIEEALLRADNFNLDPFYLFAIVDTLQGGHYLGSVTWKALHMIKANQRIWDQPLQCDVDEERVIDIIRYCGIDHSTLALPHWTSLNDANNYFDIHKRKAFFVVSKGKVIGKLNLKEISKRVDKGTL